MGLIEPGQRHEELVVVRGVLREAVSTCGCRGGDGGGRSRDGDRAEERRAA